MPLSDEQLLKLRDLPKETLIELKVHDDVMDAIRRHEKASQQRQLELEAKLREIDGELKKLKLQRKDLQREMKGLGKDGPKEPPGGSSTPEVQDIVKYFCDLLASSGYSLKYKAMKMYGYKDSRPLVTLWALKKYCEVGIDNVYAFGPERLRKIEGIGKVSPEHFRLYWSKDYATKEAPKWGAEGHGKFLEAATFDRIESLSAAQQIGPAVLQLAEFLNEYWTWYEQNDVDDLDIWEELT